LFFTAIKALSERGLLRREPTTTATVGDVPVPVEGD
jgi:hypothetical protein